MCIFVYFGQFWRFLTVYELVYCVEHTNTFCVFKPAFHHNMPPLVPNPWFLSHFRAIFKIKLQIQKSTKPTKNGLFRPFSTKNCTDLRFYHFPKGNIFFQFNFGLFSDFFGFSFCQSCFVSSRWFLSSTNPLRSTNFEEIVLEYRKI